MAKLERYRFGSLLVDGQEETGDLIILPHRIVRRWWRQEGHRLALSDLADVLDELPARLLIGTGAEGMMSVDRELLATLESRGVLTEVMPTAEAVRLYGELDSSATAIALHLTC